MSAFDHRSIAAAQSPEFDLTTFGTVEKPFLTVPRLRVRSDGPQAPSAAGGPHSPSIPAPPAADFSSLEAGLSLRAVLQRRADQVAAGYDARHDDQMPLGCLLNEAMRYGADCRDWIANRGQDPGQRHYRHKLLSFIALGLAELERLDRKVRPDG